MIETRFSEAFLKNKALRFLEREVVRNEIKIIRDLLNDGYQREEISDFSATEREHIVDWFLTRDLSNGSIYVLWVPDLDGVEVDLGEFARNYDEFWYPSSDDVWIIPRGKEWLIEIDHEEHFSIYRNKKMHLSGSEEH